VHANRHPVHDEHEQGDFDDEPEALDENETPDLDVMPKGDERRALTLKACGQLASTANRCNPIAIKSGTAASTYS
jgi:hypothetical protein